MSDSDKETSFQLEFSDIFNTGKIDFSNDCRTFAYISANNMIDVKYSQYIPSIRKLDTYGYPNLSAVNCSVPPTDISFSPDSNLILVSYSKACTFEVYSLQGELVCKVQDQPYGCSHTMWAPDSRQVLSFSAHCLRVSIYNLVDKTVAHIRCPKHNSGKGVSFTSDGKFMALAEKREEVKGGELKEFVSIYSTNNWSLLNSFVVDLIDLADIEWAPNNSFIAAWDSCLSCKLISICPLKGIVKRCVPYENALGIKTARYSPRSAFVGLGTYDEKIRLIHALNWSVICQLECPSAIPQGSDVLRCKQEQVRSNPKNYTLIQCQNSMKIPTSKVVLNDKSAPNQGIGILEFSHDESLLAARNDNMPYTVWIWDLSKLSLKAVFALEKQVKCIQWSPNSNVLIICTGTNKLFIWSQSGPGVCDVPFENSFFANKVRWTKDGQHILIYDKSDVCLASTIE